MTFLTVEIKITRDQLAQINYQEAYGPSQLIMKEACNIPAEESIRKWR